MTDASTYASILSKGYRASLDDLELDEGKLRFTEDTGEIFLDLEDERIQIARDVVTDKTESQILASTTAFEKMYLASDTHRLYYPEVGESTVTWNCIGEANSSSVDYATNAGSADYATNAASATNASSATNATSATYAENAGTAAHANNVSSATYAANAGTAAKATNADTATYATNAGTATNADTATYATNAGTAASASTDGDGNTFSTTYAPLNSPALTGQPTVPNLSTGDSSTKIANTKFVMDAISAAIGSIVGITFDVEASTADFPAEGSAGTFYLVPSANAGTNDIYDEYIWVNSTVTYEKIGSTNVDLTGYYNNVSTSGDGNAITSVQASTTGTLNFVKGSTFLTEHPSINTSSSSTTSAPAGGTPIDVIDAVTVDANGHVTSYRINTVTLPAGGGGGGGGTATYAESAGVAYAVANGGTFDFGSV